MPCTPQATLQDDLLGHKERLAEADARITALTNSTQLQEAAEKLGTELEALQQQVKNDLDVSAATQVQCGVSLHHQMAFAAADAFVRRPPV